LIPVAIKTGLPEKQI